MGFRQVISSLSSMTDLPKSMNGAMAERVVSVSIDVCVVEEWINQ